MQLVVPVPQLQSQIAAQSHTLKSCDETFTSDEVAELGDESQPCIESNVGEKVDITIDDFANKSTEVVTQAPGSQVQSLGLL